MQSFLNFNFRIISFILILSITSVSSEVLAQNGLRTFDVPGGSGGSSTQSDNSNDDTFLYVAGGLIIAGILVYALVIKKDKKTPEDTTTTKDSKLRISEFDSFDSPEQELQKVKDKIPVDLFLGMKNNEAILNDKTYILGLRFKL